MRQKFAADLAVTSAVLTLLVLAAGAGAAAEPKSDFFESYFSSVEDSMPCYGRTYDDAHLKAHGQQKTRRIEIDMAKTDSSDRTNTANRFELGIAVLTKSSPEWYGRVAICKASASGAECYLEGDGGLFRLTPADGGGLRLETGSYGISFEGQKDFLELSETGDDRVFILQRGRAECDAADAYFKADEQ